MLPYILGFDSVVAPGTRSGSVGVSLIVWVRVLRCILLPVFQKKVQEKT